MACGIGNNLPHLAAHYRQRRTRDALGGHERGWELQSSGIACFLQTISQEQRSELFDKRGFEVTHRIYFATDPAVDERDALRIVVQGSVKFIEVRSTADAGVNLPIGFHKIHGFEWSHDVDAPLNPVP